MALSDFQRAHLQRLFENGTLNDLMNDFYKKCYSGNLVPVFIVDGTPTLVDIFGNPVPVSGSGGSYPEVSTFASLPGTATEGDIYLVLNASGVPFVNRKNAGLYKYVSGTWNYLGTIPDGYFTDNVLTFFDDSDPTKQVKFEIAGVSSGTVRTLNFPNKSGTIALLDDMIPGPEGPQGLQGPQGIQGIQGIQGPTGPAGPANTLTVGNVFTGAPGSAVDVTITGTAPTQTINFTIPQGATGATGPAGPGFSDGDKGDIVISGTGTVLTIDSNAVTTPKLNNLAVTTAKVADRAVIQSKMGLADFVNKIPGADMLYPSDWTLQLGGTINIVSAPTTDWHTRNIMQLDGTAGTYTIAISKVFPVMPGEQLFFAYQAQVLAGAGTAYMQIQFASDEAITSPSYGAIGTVSTTSVSRATNILTVPTGMYYARIQLVRGNVGITSCYIGGIECRQALELEHIPLNSITTARLGGDITTAGKALLDDADAAAQRATLGLGSAALNNTGDFATAGHTHGVFTSGAAGFVPASGGGTTNFLRADGVFAAPPGGGGGGITITRQTITVPGNTAGEYTTTVAAASATPTSKVNAQLVLNSAIDQNGHDELGDMRVFAIPGTGQITFTITHERGPFVGPFYVDYFLA